MIRWEIGLIKQDGEMWFRNSSGFFFAHPNPNDYNFLPLENLLAIGGEIWGVKNLETGEIFLVGDTVIHFSDYYTEEIKSFVKPDTETDQMWFNTADHPEFVKSLSNFITISQNIKQKNAN